MLLSLGLILGLGFLGGYLINKIKIPSLVGMIIIGILIGPTVLNWLDLDILKISGTLRQIALVIILTRSGLNLDFESLKKIGRPAILLSFLPATFEIVGVALISFYLIDLPIFESILLGSVLAAVSPAVTSPRMLKLIESGYDGKNNVCKLVLVSSSIDDIFVIVIFYAFLGLVENNSFNVLNIGLIPISIVLGILLGLGVGFIVSLVINKFNVKTPLYVLLLFSLSLLMLGLETLLKQYVSFSGLLAVIVMAMVVLFKTKEKAKTISQGYDNLWLFFEIILFVLVGASLNFNYVFNNLWQGILIIVGGLIFRSIGVLICLIKTKLILKERIFVIISFLPKATVQASIGGIALSYGLVCGPIILAIAVLAIIITAPIGAFLIDHLAPKLLTTEQLK